MDKKQVTQTLRKIKENSQKRKFTQSYDLIINLKDIDLKKPEESINLFIPLHYSKGKKAKICALVGPELLHQAKEVCDLAVSVDDFPKYQDKKQAKKLATTYDFFIAQATIMPKIATAFGKVFGPKGKMPNPKAGCVVAPNANLKPVYEKLQKTVRLQTKNDPIIQTVVGNETTKDEEVVDNVMTVYDALVHQLPNGKNNIKNALLKFTMGKAFPIGQEEAEGGVKEEKPKKLAKAKEKLSDSENREGEKPKTEEEQGEKSSEK